MARQVNVRLSEGMVEEIEERSEDMGYMSRSEFIRNATRERLRSEGV